MRGSEGSSMLLGACDGHTLATKHWPQNAPEGTQSAQVPIHRGGLPGIWGPVRHAGAAPTSCAGQLTLHNAVINVILQRRAQRNRAVVVKQVDTGNAQSVVVVHPSPDVCGLILQRQEGRSTKGAKGSKQGLQLEGRSLGRRSHHACVQPCIFTSSCPV